MAGACPEAPDYGPHPEPKASTGIIAALAQGLDTEPLAARFAIAEPLVGRPATIGLVGQSPLNIAPLERLLVPPPPPPGPCLSWVTHILHHDDEIVGTRRSEAEELP